MPKNCQHPPIEQLKQEFLEKYTKNLGFAARTCKDVGIAYVKFQAWFKEDENFRNKCMEVDNLQGDFVESKLLENIRNNDTASIIFYLKAKRGWRDRQVLQIEGQVDHNFKQLQINVMDGNTKNLLESAVKLIDIEGNEIKENDKN